MQLNFFHQCPMLVHIDPVTTSEQLRNIPCTEEQLLKHAHVDGYLSFPYYCY